MSSDEFDNIPDEFDGIDGIDWTDLLSAPQNPPANVHGPAARSPSASSTWSCIYDEMDPAFIAELDALEGTHASAEAGPSHVTAPVFNRPTSNLQESVVTPIAGSGLFPQSNPGTTINVSHLFSNDLRRPASPLSSRQSLQKRTGASNSTSSSKRARSKSPPLLKSPAIDKRRKWKVDENGTMKQLLSSFEDELTCPICCDLFVAAHVGNPCGHSVCGDCGWLWSKKNKDGGCSVCRTKMSKELPMIPNIAIDNLVEKHVQALGSSGDKDWLPNGTKFTEWSFRKKKWKMDAALRAKAKVPARRKAVEIFDFLDPIDLNLAQWIAPDDEDDGDYVNDDIEEHGPTAEHQPRRRRLRSRAAWRQAGHS